MKMLAPEINQIIAKACRYKAKYDRKTGMWHLWLGKLKQFPGWKTHRECWLKECPDYCFDLNAMNRAEKILLKTTAQKIAYANALCHKAEGSLVVRLYSASSERKSLAILKAVNLPLK
jgi:hypothetical protein